MRAQLNGNVDMLIKIRRFEIDGNEQAIIIEDEENDYDGFMAWNELKSIVNVVAKPKATSAFLPYAEFSEVYEFENSKLVLDFCSDTGDINIHGDDNKMMEKFLKILFDSGKFELAI